MLELWSKRLLSSGLKPSGMFFIVESSFTSTSSGTNQYMYSYDGITWLSGTFPFVNYWQKVAYGNGVYIAVGCDKASSSDTINKYAYSNDGINWQTKSFPKRSKFYTVEYGNGVFVVPDSASTPSTNLYSKDGINWEEGGLLAGPGQMIKSEYANERLFVLNKNIGSYLVTTSVDGINWIDTTNTTISETTWSGIAYGKNVYSLVPGYANTANFFRYSVDGVNWSNCTQPATTFFVTNVCFFANKFIGGLEPVTNTSYQQHIWESEDGKSWGYYQKLPISAQWEWICASQKICVITGRYTNQICYTLDGVNWNSSSVPLSFAEPRVFYCGDK